MLIYSKFINIYTFYIKYSSSLCLDLSSSMYIRLIMLTFNYAIIIGRSFSETYLSIGISFKLMLET